MPHSPMPRPKLTRKNCYHELLNPYEGPFGIKDKAQLLAAKRYKMVKLHVWVPSTGAASNILVRPVDYTQHLG